MSNPDFQAATKKSPDFEDQAWLFEAEAARRDGFVTSETTNALLDDLKHDGSKKTRNCENDARDF